MRRETGSLSLRWEGPHPLPHPMSHRVSRLMNGHRYWKAPGLTSRLELTRCLLPNAGEGARRRWGSWTVPFLGRRSSFLVSHYLQNPPSSPFRKDARERAKPGFPDPGMQSRVGAIRTQHITEASLVLAACAIHHSLSCQAQALCYPAAKERMKFLILRENLPSLRARREEGVSGIIMNETEINKALGGETRKGEENEEREK